jgi:hypothetical protein
MIEISAPAKTPLTAMSSRMIEISSSMASARAG